MKFIPVRLAAEQFAFPPDGTGFQRIALGFRHLWQNLAIGGEKGLADHGAP